MVFQYLVVTIIVIAVIVWQVNAYRSNEKRINRLKDLFPSNNNCSVEVADDGTTTIINEHATGAFKETLDDINSYLAKNKNKTFDYHILKEIVDRNSQSLDDEVDTMLSTPLYLGLIATIFGIAFGIVMFAWKDLANLLSGANMNPEGIKILLTDVGIAMVASLFGVFFTKKATSKFNDARTQMAKNKNRFLTWIQTDLMSKLSDDITGAIIKMTNDLNEFNRTFAQNTKELKETLATVNSNYEGQVKLLQAIERIKITKIAKANIEVYDRLEGCTEELEKLFTVLANSETYVHKVTQLNQQLGSIEERTRLFEELGNYFKNEIEYVKDRQGMMRQQMSSLDSVLQEALDNMGTSLGTSLQNLTAVFQTQNQGVQQLIEEQQNSLVESMRQQQIAINEKIGQFDNPFAGLRESFTQGIEGINAAFTEQNTAIKDMLALQNLSLEEALKTQQEAILQKLKDAPSQLEALSDIAKAVERLNGIISRMEHRREMPVSGPSVRRIMENEGKEQPKGLLAKCKKFFVPICAGGSFLILLAMLILQLIAK